MQPSRQHQASQGTCIKFSIRGPLIPGAKQVKIANIHSMVLLCGHICTHAQGCKHVARQLLFCRTDQELNKREGGPGPQHGKCRGAVGSRPQSGPCQSELAHRDQIATVGLNLAGLERRQACKLVGATHQQQRDYPEQHNGAERAPPQQTTCTGLRMSLSSMAQICS